MRSIGVVSVARSDYSIYLPVLRRIQRKARLELRLMVTGMHLSPEFGTTVQTIEADGFKIYDRVEMLLSSDTPEGLAKSVGLGIIGFAQSFARSQPDILMLLGDRFEMYAAAVAALPFNIPIAHIHGGESTEGQIDEAIRHSITKMAHLHFVSTELYGKRIVRMGEEPWRVTVSGAPALDNLLDLEPMSKEELQKKFGLDLSDRSVLVTYHPVTLGHEQSQTQVEELLGALAGVELPQVFTYPNADTHGRAILAQTGEYVAATPRASLVANLGPQAYYSLLRYCSVMVGNSSSGIVEAASFKLPVVNIGIRQRGRLHAHNVIDVECDRTAILGGVRQALSPAFVDGLADLTNPYGDGHAAERIVQQLQSASIGNELLIKRFHDDGN